MTDPTIICPSCSAEIKLTESLAAPLVEATRQECEAKAVEREHDIREREAALKEQQKAVEKAKNSVDETVASALALERKAIAAEEAKRAQRAVALDLEESGRKLEELQALLEDRNARLGKAQEAQASLLRKERELGDAKRALELTIETRVQASLSEVRKKAKSDADDDLKIKVREREEQIASMQREIERLKRKSEQGSQQLQGEALELELEATLRSNFPMDSIEPVGKGEFGGDLRQHVVGSASQPCGTILWEAKRTKNWNSDWLAKLREDQRTSNAEVSVLVSRALPRDIETFGQIDGVWIAAPRFAIPLAMALRHTLIEVSSIRQFRVGQETKMDLVYEYLTGSRFRRRVEAIVERVSDMQADLESERKALTRLWSKRAAQIEGVVGATVGMYGDLQGIAGLALTEIEGLELPMLEKRPSKNLAEDPN